MKTDNKIRKDIDSKLSMLCAETDRIRKYNLVKDVYDLILNDEDECDGRRLWHGDLDRWRSRFGDFPGLIPPPASCCKRFIVSPPL